ncbi:MAG: cobalamin-dependent protein, partial [Longimicrobiales bacterium]|nr:cobalamin-dependent protein [Longimicrobiales bacterium]
PREEPGTPTAAEETFRGAMAAVEALDPARLERLLRREVVALGAEPFLDRVVVPLLERIGTQWREGRLRPAHEHVAVAVVRQILGWMLERARGAASGDTLVVGTLAGERHELGALLAAATAALRGWRVVFTGEDLPPEELALTARSVGARAVGVSVTAPSDPEGVPGQLRALLADLPADVTLYLGGGAAPELGERVRDRRIRVMVTLGEFRAALARTDPPSPGEVADPALVAG